MIEVAVGPKHAFMNSTPGIAPKPKHWLLQTLRRWHTWIGLAAALFFVVIALTGIVLNYKKPIFQAVGLEPRLLAEGKKNPAADGKPAKEASSAIDPSELAVSYEAALAIARRELGSGGIERLELKREQGEWLYKLKQPGGAEIWISAATGAHFRKGAYEKVKRAANGAPVKSFDWGKLLLDLHTGKIGGAAGVALMTGMAALLIFLTVSGVYMWLKPVLIRRNNAAGRAATKAHLPAAKSAPPLGIGGASVSGGG